MGTQIFDSQIKDNIALTGTPTAPTPSVSDDSTRIATTEFIKNQVASDTVKGMVELATPAEVLAGEDDERAVTPAGFKAAFGEFYPVGVTPTYVDFTHFTVSGDLTAIFTQGRVLKITDTGGTFNAICSTSAYNSGTGLTTVTVAGDTIDSGISAVLYAVQQVTGAIWESGSNANGTYVKFADGTLMMSGTLSFPGGIQTAVGQIYKSDLLSVTLPAASISATRRIFAQDVGSANIWCACAASGSVQMFCYTPITTARDARIFVYGRWF